MGLLLGAAIVAAAAVYAVWHRPRASAGHMTDAVAAPTGPPSSTAPQPAELAQTAAAQRGGQAGSGDAPITGSLSLTLRQRFRESTDYASFIESILSDARAGDRDAQYYVHAALSFCDSEFRLFRKRAGSGWLTRDEGLVRAARRRDLPIGYVEAVDEKCRTLMEGSRSDLGDSKRWLEDAANKGQPIAMATLATAQLLAAPSGDKKASARASAREQLASALESKDPEVMWAIGELQYALNPESEDSNKTQWAWALAACERGYECGPDALWLQFACRWDQCPPGETVVDYIKRILQTDFPAVEELAREINANIDAEAWSDIDIDG
jgi:hypothetical protein